MQQQAILAKGKRRFKTTVDPNPETQLAPILPDKRHKVAEPSPSSGPMCCSNRASPYARQDLLDVLEAYAITTTMSRRVDGGDWARSETTSGSSKLSPGIGREA